MVAVGSIGFHLALLMPCADARTHRRMGQDAQYRTFQRRDVLHARGLELLTPVRRSRWARHRSSRGGDQTEIEARLATGSRA